MITPEVFTVLKGISARWYVMSGADIVSRHDGRAAAVKDASWRAKAAAKEAASAKRKGEAMKSDTYASVGAAMKGAKTYRGKYNVILHRKLELKPGAAPVNRAERRALAARAKKEDSGSEG